MATPRAQIADLGEEEDEEEEEEGEEGEEEGRTSPHASAASPWVPALRETGYGSSEAVGKPVTSPCAHCGAPASPPRGQADLVPRRGRQYYLN